MPNLYFVKSDYSIASAELYTSPDSCSFDKQGVFRIVAGNGVTYYAGTCRNAYISELVDSSTIRLRCIPNSSNSFIVFNNYYVQAQSVEYYSSAAPAGSTSPATYQFTFGGYVEAAGGGGGTGSSPSTHSAHDFASIGGRGGSGAYVMYSDSPPDYTELYAVGAGGGGGCGCQQGLYGRHSFGTPGSGGLGTYVRSSVPTGHIVTRYSFTVGGIYFGMDGTSVSGSYSGDNLVPGGNGGANGLGTRGNKAYKYNGGRGADGPEGSHAGNDAYYNMVRLVKFA